MGIGSMTNHKKPQIEEFKVLGRHLEADEDEARFSARLQKVAKVKPKDGMSG